MRPVSHLKTGTKITDHKKAKPYLIKAMGEYCAYCERHIDADNLHVEHVKPQVSHPKLALKWANFLLACGICNAYKRHFQDTQRQVGALAKQAWPHLDNTFNAFTYDQHGRVGISSSLPANQQLMADETLKMAGLNNTPATAARYRELGQIYELTKRRERAWENALIALATYRASPTNLQRKAIVNQAAGAGFFSIWMAAFDAYPTVKVDLIKAFQASTACFSSIGTSVSPRQAGRI